MFGQEPFLICGILQNIWGEMFFFKIYILWILGIQV